MNSKKPFVCILIILLSFTSLIGLFSPTKAETWTDITLPYTITEGGNYRIAEACNSSGRILSINASNVIVDGQDKLIQSTQSEGDYVIAIEANCTNVLLMNINETGSDYGLYALETGNFTVQDSTFNNNTAAALFVYSVTDFVVQHSRLSNNSNGFVAVDSGSLTISDSHIKNNTNGIQVVQNNDVTIEGSYLNNNTNALTAMNCTNVAAYNSTFTENYEAITASYTALAVDNINVSNNNDTAIRCLYGNLTALNFAANNNTIGIYSIYCNVTLTYASLTNNIASIFALFSNLTVVDCALNDNILYGAITFMCPSVSINDCSLNNNSYGLMSAQSQNLVLDNSIIANNTIGLEEYLGNNTLVTGNLFTQNGFVETDNFGGAIIAEDTNCTVTNNAFTNNYDGLMLGVFSSELNNTQTYHYNSFINNSFTFDFNYALPSNFTNQQIYFYNNLVNDSAYINPESFSLDNQLAPPNTVLHLNTTLQAGARAYSMGSMIGGNYWAHPNGTGPSETGTDANKDGFIDTPFELFANETYVITYDYLPYSPSDSATLSFTNGASQSLVTMQGSAGITVKIQDLYGPVISGETLNLATSSSRGEFYSDPACEKQITTLTIPVNASIASFYYKDLADGTPTITVSGQNMISAATIFTITTPPASTSNPTRTPSSTQTVTPTPTPTATPNTIEATKDDNTKATITISGNITVSQFSNMTIVSNQTAVTTTVSFTVTGETGTSGFCNMTIPKNQIPYGTTINVNIDGQPAPNQGYTQDSQNYYVWFTTSFSTHNITLEFVGQSQTPEQANMTPIYVATVAAIIVVAVVAVLVVSRRKK